MKTKLSLKKLKFKELFVEHVEKAVFAVMGVCLLMFIISAIGHEKLPPDSVPLRLEAASKLANDHVQKSELNEEEICSKDKPKYADRVQRDPVKLAIYESKVPINAPIIESRVTRDEPLFRSVRDLRVTPGVGPIATVDPNAQQNQQQPLIRRNPRIAVEQEPTVEKRRVEDGRKVGVRVNKDTKLVVKYWAMVTALVPVREQKAEYLKAFENAVSYDSEQDVPRYVGYLIERAEVVSGDMRNLKWTQVNADEDFMYTWTEEAQERVMPEYVFPLFVIPLAPRYGSDWVDDIGHAPEIPFEPKRNAFAGEMGVGRPFRGGETEEGEFRPRGRIPAAGRDRFAEAEDEGLNKFQGRRKKRQQPVAEDDPKERRRQQELVAMVGRNDANDPEKPVKGLDHLLFRFCDFTVEPGKQYVYRVQLAFRNPNQGIPVKYLKRPELAEASSRTSDWSEISPIVTIPYGDKILAGPVTSPSVMKEPVATIRVVQVKEDVGAEVPMEGDIFRGSLANFLRKATQYVNPIERTVEDYVGNFETDAVLLDMRGGRPVWKDKEITEPGELLMLSRGGQLMAINEFDDEDVWKNYAVPEERKPNDMMFEGEGMLRGREMEGEGMRLPPSRTRRSGKGPPADALGPGSPASQRQAPKRTAKPRGESD
jgi:hypothetical protein